MISSDVVFDLSQELRPQKKTKYSRSQRNSQQNSRQNPPTKAGEDGEQLSGQESLSILDGSANICTFIQVISFLQGLFSRKKYLILFLINII